MTARFYVCFSIGFMGACALEEPTKLDTVDILELRFDEEQPGRFIADEQMTRSVLATFRSGASSGKTLHLTTNIGLLRPGAPESDRRTLDLVTDGRDELAFVLFGTHSGRRNSRGLDRKRADESRVQLGSTIGDDRPRDRASGLDEAIAAQDELQIVLQQQGSGSTSGP